MLGQFAPITLQNVLDKCYNCYNCYYCNTLRLQTLDVSSNPPDQVKGFKNMLKVTMSTK